MGTIQSLRLVRPLSKNLDFPFLTGYNTVHTFSQTLVENHGPLLSLGTIQRIYLVPFYFPRIPNGYNTVHNFSQTPVKNPDSPSLTGNTFSASFSQTSDEKPWVQYSAYFLTNLVENPRPSTPTGYNTVHTFSKTPVENHRLSNSIYMYMYLGVGM